MRNKISVLRNFVGASGRPRRILIRSYNVARSFEKMMKIVEALDVGYEQAFVFPDGSEITIGIK